jgi:hypothetical protein
MIRDLQVAQDSEPSEPPEHLAQGAPAVLAPDLPDLDPAKVPVLAPDRLAWRIRPPRRGCIL